MYTKSKLLCIDRHAKCKFIKYSTHTTRYLLSDAKTYRVLLVHSPLCLDAVQHALCEVLLTNMHVPSVSFVDSHVLCTLAVGRTSALVVDVGHLETCVMPVYDGRPMQNLITTTPRAGRFLSRTLRALLARHAETTAPIDDVLHPSTIDEVQTRALLVGEPCTCSRTTVSPLDVDAFASEYAKHATNTSAWSLRVHGQSVLHVPGWLRERACEVFWEPGDEDEASVVECVWQCISRLPLDTRRELLGSILLAGGSCLIPGWTQRFVQELQKPGLTSALQYGAASMPADPTHAMRVQVLNASATYMPANVLAWSGASIAGHLHAEGTTVWTRDSWNA